MQADFTKALDNFQRAQRSAAQKEKEAIKKYKNQGVSPLMHKQVVNLKNKRTPLGLGDCSEIQSSYKFLQVPPGEGGGGANLIDIEEGQNKRQVITSCKQIKYDTFISLVFVVSPPLEPNICFPCSQLMLEEEQNLEYLQERERSVAQLEADIGDVNQIFKDLAAMVHDQVMMRSKKKENQVFFLSGRDGGLDRSQRGECLDPGQRGFRPASHGGEIPGETCRAALSCLESSPQL